MKILKLEAENFKKLKAVEITPTGHMVPITGPNGAGKSSVLDAIWAALGGAKHIQAVPIRKGATSARVRLDLGELIVERRFTATGTTLTVENAEGARYKTPQAMLDALLGALTFDPLAFLGMDPRAQFDALRTIAPLDVDVEQLDGLNRRDFDARTDVNRQVKALRAQADGIGVPGDLPAERLDTAALLARLTEASTVNTDIEKRRGRRDQAAQEIAETKRRALDKRGTVKRLEEQIQALKAEALTLDKQASDLQTRLDVAEELPEPVNAEAIRVELQAAETTNKGIDQRERKLALTREAETREGQAKALTEAIEAREQAKADAMARAEMPVPGLGFGDGVVTFGGVPFEQASSAEQLRVSVALGMAGDPKLEVMRIKDGSLLDEENLTLLATMARELDYQVWIEKVDSSGKIGIYIEDGSVVAVDGEPVAQPAGVSS